MRAKILACALPALILATIHLAEAQQLKKIPRIGFLFSLSLAVHASNIDVFRGGLRELGYVEGKNIFIEYRSAEGKLDRLPPLVDELVGLKVDVIVAISTAAAVAAKNATQTIPIVFTSGGDPVAVGLIDSLARPGGNLTGINAMTVELAGKRLELLKDTVAKLSRIAVLWNPRSVASAEEWRYSLLPARELSLQLHSMEVNSADQYESVFKDAIKARSGALVVTSGSINNSNQKGIADLAAKHRLPAISRWEEFVESGGLLSYGPDETERYRRIAYYIDKILKGTQPADLPVEQPKKFKLAINLTTAKQIGVTIPPIVLARADKVLK
jgi:putative tryptophan/tyrosine transport system substrate-binding protein